MTTLHLPPQLQARLDALPQGLQAHISRVRAIARELADAHSVDPVQAELTAAAHDVARAVHPQRLLEEAKRLGLSVNSVESHAPILLHGPVGALWLELEGSVSDPGVLEGVRWHTTAHPDLALVGQVVFLADKLDPVKASIYPFQAEVREAAFRDIPSGMLAFLGGAIAGHLQRRELIHPALLETRNTLLYAGSRRAGVAQAPSSPRRSAI